MNLTIQDHNHKEVKIMCRFLKFTLTCFCVLCITTGMTAQAETLKTRIGDLSFTHDFANGYPTDATVEKLFNEMDFQRATQAYIWSIPIVSMAHRSGQAAGRQGEKLDSDRGGQSLVPVFPTLFTQEGFS